MTGEPKKKPRVDRRKNVWKVAEVLAKNPNKTIREVAKEAWIGKTTAANSMKELGESWKLDDFFEAYEQQQRILCDDIKDTICDEILWKFVTLCWSKSEATRQIENFLFISIEWMDRKRKNVNNITRYKVLHNSGFKCQACGEKPQPTNEVVLHIDHIVPFSLWGLDVMDNYQVLCWQCNSSKNNSFIYNHNDER